MCPLRRVEDHRAGPSALGILIPPGRRTIVIVRPRSLAWDLLLLRPGSIDAFHDLPRADAERIANELLHSLRQWSEGQSSHVEEVACPAGGGFWVRVRIGPFSLLACGRQPGRPYQPQIFPDVEAALSAATQLRCVLRPPPHKEQEVYLNNLHFQKDSGERPV